VLLGLVVQVGDGEIGAERAEGGSASRCYQMFVGNANDEPLLAPSSLAFTAGINRALPFFGISIGSPQAYLSAACFKVAKAWRRSFASAVLAIS
jgi:hypothetical protein